MKLIRAFPFFSAAAFMFAGSAFAQNAKSWTEEVEGTRIVISEAVTGVDRPWGLAFLPDGSGRALITERDGAVRVVDVKSGTVGALLSGVPKVVARGQGGLLDVALSPDFAKDRAVFLSFSEPHSEGARTAVFRAVLEGQSLVEGRVIFRQSEGVDNGFHFGSRLVFGRDGMLYVTTGDRYDQKASAQIKNSHHGKVLRMTRDGKPAPGNPFANEGASAAYVWSIGHRNVQGAALQPQTGLLWTAEHGPKGGDEINLPRAGKNYGWPIVGFGIDYSGAKLHNATSSPNMEAPLHYWVPSIGAAGMNFYTGNSIPAWQGKLFVAGLASRELSMLTLQGDTITKEARLLKEIGARLRHVVTGPDGALYVLTDEKQGRILRITLAR